jgi:hypothetical protein
MLGKWDMGHKETPMKLLPRVVRPSLISRPSTPPPLILQEGVITPKDEAWVWPKATSRRRSLARRSAEVQEVTPKAASHRRSTGRRSTEVQEVTLKATSHRSSLGRGCSSVGHMSSLDWSGIEIHVNIKRSRWTCDEPVHLAKRGYYGYCNDNFLNNL